MPRKKNLSAFFDKVDLGVDAIGNWGEFEKEFYGEKFVLSVNVAQE